MSARRLQFVVQDLGKTFGGSKKRVMWKFWFVGDTEVRARSGIGGVRVPGAWLGPP